MVVQILHFLLPSLSSPFPFDPSSPFPLSLLLPLPLPFSPLSPEPGGSSGGGGGSSPHIAGPASGHWGVGGPGIGLGLSVGGQTSIPSALRGQIIGSVSFGGGSGPGPGIGSVAFGGGGSDKWHLVLVVQVMDRWRLVREFQSVC